MEVKWEETILDNTGAQQAFVPWHKQVFSASTLGLAWLLALLGTGSFLLPHPVYSVNKTKFKSNAWLCAWQPVFLSQVWKLYFGLVSTDA